MSVGAAKWCCPPVAAGFFWLASWVEKFNWGSFAARILWPTGCFWFVPVVFLAADAFTTLLRFSAIYRFVTVFGWSDSLEPNECDREDSMLFLRWMSCSRIRLLLWNCLSVCLAATAACPLKESPWLAPLPPNAGEIAWVLRLLLLPGITNSSLFCDGTLRPLLP